MKAIILAGGSGTRLWPASRSHYPKQFLSFENSHSLLQMTVKRLLKFISADDVIIMTNAMHEEEVKNQLGALDTRLTKHIVLEPVQRNTAPAVALAVQYAQDVMNASEEEVMFVGSSDHIIAPEDEFVKYLQMSEEVAHDGHLVTYGIVPNKPETGYGYIKKGEPFKEAYVVEKFVEKPNFEIAKEYLLSGEYFWNSGMFAFAIKNMLKELRKHAPEIYNLLGSYEKTLSSFEKMPNISIDYAIMEKSSNIAVLPLNLVWSDIGSWDSVYEFLDKDEQKNVLKGDVCAIDTENSLIYGNKERFIATIGLKDIIIVDTEDALLVAKRGESQKVKEVSKNLSSVGCCGS